MSSRYTPSYTSRYGSGRDYGSSAYSSGSSRDRDTSSLRDKDYTSSRYSSTSSARPKYSSYTSKYSTDYGKSTDKMEDYSAAPIAKDEIEELSYQDKTPVTPTEDIVDALPQEVLQESQISDFVEDDEDKESEIEEVKLTLSSGTDEENEIDNDDEVRKAQELFASSTQIRETSPISPASPVASPVKQFSYGSGAISADRGREAENRTPSPTVINAKKLGGIPWPPKTSDSKKEAGETEVLPKKRVSDLIARFNTGVVEEAKKTDDSYKTEYGARSNVGKVGKHNFA